MRVSCRLVFAAVLLAALVVLAAAGDHHHGQDHGHGHGGHGQRYVGGAEGDHGFYSSVQACRGCVGSGSVWCQLGTDDFDGFCMVSVDEQCTSAAVDDKARVATAQEECENTKPDTIHACSRCTADAYTWCQDPHHADCDSCGACVAPEIGCNNTGFVHLYNRCPRDDAMMMEVAEAFHGVAFALLVIGGVLSAFLVVRVVKAVRARCRRSREARQRGRGDRPSVNVQARPANAPQDSQAHYMPRPASAQPQAIVMMPYGGAGAVSGAAVAPQPSGAHAAYYSAPAHLTDGAPAHRVYSFPSQTQHLEHVPSAPPQSNRRGYSSIPTDEYA